MALIGRASWIYNGVHLSALDAYYFPSLEEVVAQIKALPFKSENIREATGSLRELLASDPEDAEFDLDAWTQEWARVEEERKTAGNG